jgi:hypothetical protein
MAMAKSQKRSNREIRKPKQAKAKAAPAARSFLEVAGKGSAKPSAQPKRPAK